MDFEQLRSLGGGLIIFRNHLSNLELLLREELGAASLGSTKSFLTTSRAIADKNQYCNNTLRSQ